MKSIRYSIICFLFVCLNSFSQNSDRTRKNINDNWKFSLSNDLDYNKADFDDSNWRELDLPHDWSVEGEFSDKNTGRNAWLPAGIGWYRKKVFIENSLSNKEFKIEFDGIYKNAKIWINGHYVGQQHDGYTSFYFNITSFLKFGSDNTIAVQVDNKLQPNCRWYSGSGIYRNVWLTSTNKLAIDQWGTFITTPKVSKEKAEINIATTFKKYSEAVKFTLKTFIYNNKGEKVSFNTTEYEIDRKTSKTVSSNLEIVNPQLWSVAVPNLYTVKSEVLVNGKTVDIYRTTFGVRTIEFNADNGFFLNGENLKMKGVCLHHEAGVFGAAVPISIWKRRLRKLKNLGCNAIRTAHNPMASEFLDLCDEMGFLVMNEFVDKWYVNSTPEDKKKYQNTFYNPTSFYDPNFELEWEKNYSETIKRDRNHPSVIIWSVGNENHSPGTIAQIEGLRKYTSFVRSLDNTRPVISGMERGKDGVPSEKVDAIIKTCKEMDLIALNYGEQWCKAIGKQNPGMPYVSTESYTYFNSTPEKRFANIERSPWIDVLDNSHNMGLYLWVGIDYMGESRTFSKLGSSSGLLDRAGFRKEISYLYESFWSEKPMVRIAVYEKKADDFSGIRGWGAPAINENWNLSEEKVVDVVTYTNCEEVALYLNGSKIGVKKLSDFSNFIMKWRDIIYQPGELRAVGIIKGNEVCEFNLNTTKKAHHIDYNIELDREGKTEIYQIEIGLKDKRGNKITQEEIKLDFELIGEGEIIALDNGDMNNRSSFNNTKSCLTNKGQCLAVIKADRSKGNLKLVISSSDIGNKEIKLRKD